MVLKIQNEVKSTQKQPSRKKKKAALKRLGEKVVKSKVAAIMAAAFDFTTFFTQAFEGRTLFYSLTVFEWEEITHIKINSVDNW